MNFTISKRIRALVIGGIIATVGLILVRDTLEVIIINSDAISAPINFLINALAFIAYWLVLSYFIYKFSIYNVLSLLIILLVAYLADLHIKVENNPITVPLIILFWLGVAALLLPQLFQKYKLAILSVYGFVISYHFFDFISTPDYAIDDRANFASLTLSPIPIFVALWAYEQWRWLTTLKADKAKAELAMLKIQINPHFFFNTLNNLYGLAVEKSDQAPEVILKLSDMMRYTIYEGKEDYVFLADEVNYLENYIDLHKIRYQTNVDIRFTKQISGDFKVAPLLFIILLENAFKHGVERMTEGAFVYLDLKAEQNQITFSIENNFEEATTKQSTGIGLENLRKRLEHMYPKQHQLEIEKKASIYKAQLIINL